MVNPDDLDSILGRIRKEYGDDSVGSGNEKSALKRIPTGDLQLDFATGGGIPIGRWSHLYGERSSAKTLTAYKCIASAQNMGQTAAYYNAEKQFDPVWAQLVGVDIDKLLVVEGSVIEQVGTNLESLLSAVHLHVIDSVGACISLAELNGELTDSHYAASARAWSRVVRLANERFNDSENTILLINQTREQMKFGAPPKPTGGVAIEFASSLSLEFKRKNWLFADKSGELVPDGSDTNTLTGDTEPGGIEFQVRVQKSRVCQPFRTARMRLDFKTGQYDKLWTLAQSAIWFNLVDRSGSWYTLPDGNKVQGVNGLKNFITDNNEFAKEIENKVLGEI